MSRIPIDFFDRTYVVNLRSRPDRRRQTAAELSRVHVPADAVRWWDATQDADAHGFPSPGAYGCFQSHLRALSQARDDGLSSVLMLEDDIMIVPSRLGEWPAIESYIDSHDWDLLNLGYAKTITGSPVSAELMRVSSPVRATHCYAVNGRVIADLVDFLVALQQREQGHPQGGKMHYDGALNVFCQQYPAVVRLAARQKVVRQRSSRSDIASPDWFDDHSILRAAVSRVRRVKNLVRRRNL